MLARLKSFFNPSDETRLLHRIFWTGFLVRVLYVTLAHTYRIRVAEDHFQFGWEAGRIARALLTGYGYSDPFANAFLAHTGPTAWLPPVYPLLLAGIFRLFGVYTHASAWVLFTLQSAFSAATALATYRIAARCFSRRVALWSAWIWALYPAAMQYAVRWPWETTISTALFSFVLALSLRMRGVEESGQWSVVSGKREGKEGKTLKTDSLTTYHLPLTTDWLYFGFLWGLIALSNSTLLIFLPVCALWILLPNLTPRSSPGAPSLRSKGGILHLLAGPILSALVFLALIAPWTLRNQRVFHAFIPLRGNFGAELFMGNGPGSNGLLMEYYHPFQDAQQLRDYATLGEVRYVARQSAAARAFIAAHPAHFAADVARRTYFFWAGVPHPSDEAWYNEAGRTLNFAFISLAGLMGLVLALRHRIPAAGLFACAFLLLPIPYYIVTVHARFRHPLEPLIAIFAVYLFQSAARPRAIHRRAEGASAPPKAGVRPRKSKA
jgi:4-amino-4-deoxy-L-arabinose transferase-like glycosyltransferase